MTSYQLANISLVHNTPAAIFKTIAYYIYECGDYGPGDYPIGFRSTLLEAEALRHFVAENRYTSKKGKKWNPHTHYLARMHVAEFGHTVFVTETRQQKNYRDQN
jgi:hypothetical protein